MLKEVAAFAASEQLWHEGDTIVVGLSGGPDSMALLDMLYRLAPEQRLTIVAAHLDHGFRGEESKREAEAVQAWTASIGVPCEAAYIDVPAFIEETRMNLQAAAREKRYDFLWKTAIKYNASRIALAHHADDQAETVLMRIIRGTSISGLGGIPLRRKETRFEKNVELIRPLLRMNKDSLLSYCQERGLSYNVDSSNEKRDYLRNELRLDVLPMLTQYNPQLSGSLNRLAELASTEDSWMEAETERIYASMVKHVSNGWQIGCKQLNGLHVALQRRMIKLILKHMGIEAETATFDGVETIRAAVADGAATTWSADVGNGIRCLREYDTMRFLHAGASDGADADKSGSYAYSVEEEARSLAVPEAAAVLMFSREQYHGIDHPSSRLEAVFDADQLSFPLTVRNRRPGDRMRVLGLNGAKKVQDMFVDDRIAPSRRERLPLLADADGTILWIPGVRRSASALISNRTVRVLRIRAQFIEE